MNLLAIVVGVIVFLIFRRQQEEDARAALGRAPFPGGADGSPQAQAAAAHSGTTTVGNSQQNVEHGLESAFGAGAGAAACVSSGFGVLAPLCAKAGGYLVPKAIEGGKIVVREGAHLIEAGAKGAYRHTIGAIPFGGGGTYDVVAYNASLAAAARPVKAPAFYGTGRF